MKIILALAMVAAITIPARAGFDAVNNPGAVRCRHAKHFDGLANPPFTGGFCNFRNASLGVAAIAKILRTYYLTHDLRTAEKIISRYAPPHENRTDRYIIHFASGLGVMADEVFPLLEWGYMKRAVKLIIEYENVGPFPTEAQIDIGLTLAGIKRGPTRQSQVPMREAA
jgi:hypothetical protein